MAGLFATTGKRVVFTRDSREAGKPVVRRMPFFVWRTGFGSHVSGQPDQRLQP